MILGAIIGVGISLLSSLSANKRNKKQQKEMMENNMAAINSDRKELDSWYKRVSNNDFLDSTSIKNNVLALSEEKKQRDEAIGNNAVRNGYTPEAEISKAAASNKAYSDSIYKLANLGNEYRYKIDNIYFKNKMDLNSKEREVRNGYAPTKSTQTDYTKYLNTIKNEIF